MVEQVCPSTGERYQAAQCECTGQCGEDHHDRCNEVDRIRARHFKGQVVLSTAHVDQDPTNNQLDNLLLLCQACHNRLDAPHRHHNASRTRTRQRIEADRQAQQGFLFEPVMVE